MILNAIDMKLALQIFLILTAVGHFACALGVLFYHMKLPPKTGPSIAMRFLITLATGAIGLVYFVFIKRDPVDQTNLETTVDQPSLKHDKN